MYDLIIKNGTVVDGAGSPRYNADIAVTDGKIVAIKNAISVETETTMVIDAKGLVIAPGFIDNHSHSDLLVLCDNSGYNMLEQGITTEITGMCGLGLAPASPGLLKYVGGEAIYKERTDLIMSLLDHASLFNTIGKMDTGTNIVFNVAHGAIRIAVMGFENRKPTDSEMSKMKELVREGMDSGAIGLSTGLIYPPGVYTLEDEIVELCKVVVEYGGRYYTHIRNESHNVIEAVKEAIRIGEKAGIPVIISHHKIAAKDNWGASLETLRLIDEANSKGIEVSADMYPYNAGATYLKTALPPKYSTQGTEVLVEMLKDKSIRQEVREGILGDRTSFENLVLNCGFENIRVIMSGYPNAEGKTIAQYAAEIGADPFDVMFDVIIKSEGNAFGVFTMMSDEDIERIMVHPSVMYGTDGMVVTKGLSSVPRAYGTFPRILGRYVREKKLLPLEEAVRKMTSLPASKAGLLEKGLIKPGFDADLVIFNPETIIDRSELNNIAAKNEGIAYVLVNGRIAVKDNAVTGIKAGRVILSK